MAEYNAPFIIERTIRQLTFYRMDGKSYVRKKSSLTRRKVLYAPCFKNTRHFAALMGRASKIGSAIYNQLPAYWRQGWMYRSFTGEAYTLLKARKTEEEIRQVLWQRYVSLVAPVEANTVPIQIEPKRTYRKQNSEYWANKTRRSNRRKAHKQKVMYNAGLMAQASKIGSKLYARVPRGNRSDYQYLTGLAFKLLKEDISEEDILSELLPTLPGAVGAANIIHHPKGHYYFIPTSSMRISDRARDLPPVRFYSCTQRVGDW